MNLTLPKDKKSLLISLRIGLCLLWVTIFFSLQAQSGSVKGFVFDENTKLGLANANIELNEGKYRTTANELGIFTFSKLEAGTYQLKVSYVGYVQQELINIDVTNDLTTIVRIDLTPTIIDLPTLEIRPTLQQNLNIISAIDIQARPLNNAQEILRIVPGLVIAQHAGGGKAEQIFLRGFDIDHGTDIQLTLDGMPVNMVSHAHGQGYADLHFIIPELVNQVDFKKGPYYAQVGNFSTAGYAGFQTSNALAESMIKLEAGQFDSYRIVGAIDLLGEQMKAKNQNAYIASEYMFTNGYFDSPQNFTRFNLLGKYTGMIGDNQSLNVSFSTFNSEWDASGQIPERAVAQGLIGRFGAIDDTEGGATSRTNLNAILSKNLGNGAFLKNQLYYINYNFELYSNFTFFADNPIDGDQIRQKENRNLIGYNGSWMKTATLAGRTVETEIGVNFRYDNSDDNELSRTKNREETIEQLSFGDIDEVNTAVYANATYEIAPKLLVNAGLRYDQFNFTYLNRLSSELEQQSQSKGVFSPKLNLFYNATTAVQLYANFGQSFHSNDTRVVVAQRGEEILPKATGLEAGIIFKPVPSLLLNLAAWQLDLQQEFVYVGDEAIVEPSGATRRRGIDVSARWQLTKWLFADTDLTYTYARAVEEEKGLDFIPLAPIWTGIGGLTVLHKSGFNGSFRYRYLADRPANEDNSLTAEGYFLLDALISYRLPKFEFSISLQNVLNQDWKEAQFETESRLQNEVAPVGEIHFTPGTPRFLKGSFTYFF